MELRGYWKSSGYLKLDKFYKYLKDKDIKITRKELNEFLNKQKSIQITKVVNKPKIFNSILADSPGVNYQMDIMIYSRKEFNGYGAILGVIDVNSRYAQCIALKTRKKKDADSEVMTAIKKIMKIIGYPKNINTDKEFTNTAFLKLMEQHNVKIWFSHPDEIVGKNAIIERFWRTLAGRLQDYALNTGRQNWNNYLKEIVENYNNTYHSTVRGKPKNIWKGKDSNKQDIIILKPELKVGDLVRYSIPKKTFSKGDVETYSDILYKIVKKDDERKNRWVLLNTKTNKELSKSYLDRDLITIIELDEPIEYDTRQRTTGKDSINMVKQRKNTKIEMKNLKSNLTDKLIKPSDEVRKIKKPAKFK